MLLPAEIMTFAMTATKFPGLTLSYLTHVFPDGAQTGIIFSSPGLLTISPPGRNLTPYN